MNSFHANLPKNSFRPTRGHSIPRLATAILVAALSSAPGCHTAPPPDPMAEAAVTGEKPVAMIGNATMLGGKIAATVSISRGFDRGSGRPGRPAGGNGSRGRHANDTDASAGGLSESDSFAGFEGATETEQKEMYASMVRQAQAHRAAGSPMPPVSIHLRLENMTETAQEVEVLEANSDLGNFAVRPKKLTIPPHQVGNFDPMVSQLGVTSDVIPLKLTLRVGKDKDSQTVDVHTLFTSSSLKQ